MKIEFSSKKIGYQKKLLIGLLVIVFGLCVVRLYLQQQPTVNRSDVTLQTVQQGDVDIYIDVYGELVSAQEQLLTAPARGNVKKILVYPGSKVETDTPILLLANPQLEQEVNSAKALLAEIQSQREALEFSQENERLDHQSQIEHIKSELEKALLEQSVQNKLRTLGVAASIELQRAALTVKQQTQRLEFEQQRYAHFIAMQKHRVKQMDITLKQQESATQALTKQLSQMQVRAGMSGSLQSLAVELGETVQLGQALAKVGSDSQLLARLRLPRNQADQIDINAPVIIDTQKGTMQARIQRIESVVTNNSVRADAIIDGPNTSNARPSLSISAKVFVNKQRNALFVTQNNGWRPNSTHTLFVLNDDQHLQKTDITFGPLTLDKVVISEGLQAGDQLALLDTAKYTKFEQLSITD